MSDERKPVQCDFRVKGSPEFGFTVHDADLDARIAAGVRKELRAVSTELMAIAAKEPKTLLTPLLLATVISTPPPGVPMGEREGARRDGHPTWEAYEALEARNKSLAAGLLSNADARAAGFAEGVEAAAKVAADRAAHYARGPRGDSPYLRTSGEHHLMQLAATAIEEDIRALTPSPAPAQPLLPGLRHARELFAEWGNGAADLLDAEIARLSQPAPKEPT